MAFKRKAQVEKQSMKKKRKHSHLGMKCNICGASYPKKSMKRKGVEENQERMKKGRRF